jgi:2-dehydro-3-deoxygluconokinase
MSVVAFGELLLRLKSPGAERLLQGPLLEASFGGAEFNVLALLSRLQIATEYVGVLPSNALGVAARAEIRRHGVGDRHVGEADGRLGLYFLEGGAGLRPARVEYDRAASAFARLQPERFDWPAILAGARWLHLTGITAALGEAPAAAMTAAARAACALGVPVSLDVNWRQQLWRASQRRPLEVLGPVLECCTLVFAGVNERAACLDESGDERSDPEADFPQFARRLLDRQARVRAVASTLRRSRSIEEQEIGAVCLDREAGLQRAASVRLPAAVDRIGSGDAFVAGCLFGALSGWHWERTLAFAVAAAALKHSVPGDVARLTRAEIEAAIDGEGVGRVLR